MHSDNIDESKSNTNTEAKGEISTGKSTSTKYVFVIGGVLSGLGKGIVTSSVAKLLQKRGYKVTAIKIDPYLNIDPGTMRPTEHGEVWVTPDGGEIDQDLGNYERFLNINIPKKNNITTGQVFKKVIEDERAGKYLGKTVQLIPHIPNEVVRRIKDCSEGYDVCVIEIGGVIGDYENIPFIFAAKKLSLESKAIFMLVSYFPKPSHLGEVKSKPTQHAIKELRSLGIWPDYVIARSQDELDDIRKKKISENSYIPLEKVISNPDIDSIYKIPLVLEKQNVGKTICEDLGLENKPVDWSNWEKMFDKFEHEINIAMVCKYLDVGTSTLKDSYVSVNEALQTAGRALKTKVNIGWVDAKNLPDLTQFDGVIVPGGFGASGIEGKINAIQFARENDIPFLGLCLGMQLAVVEFGRNVCKMSEANSTEFNPSTQFPLIHTMESQKEILEKNNYGGTMRLGNYTAVLKPDSIIQKLYDSDTVVERHRHRFEVNNSFIPKLEESGLVFSGFHEGNNLAEFIELPSHKFFVATQAHPEFTSRFEKPNPLFLGFVKACLS